MYILLSFYFLCTFLIMLVIPMYPFYRNVFHCGFEHLLRALLVSIVIFTFCVLFDSDVSDGISIKLPLIAASAWADIREKEIPDLPLLILFALSTGRDGRDLGLALAFAAVLSVFAMKKKIGFGDVKLMGVMILNEGRNALIAFAAASLFCLVCVKLKKGPSQQTIPFAPFLCAGYVFTLFLPL